MNTATAPVLNSQGKEMNVIQMIDGQTTKRILKACTRGAITAIKQGKHTMLPEAIEFAMTVVMLLEQCDKPLNPTPAAEAGSRRAMRTVVSPACTERYELIADHLHAAAIIFHNLLVESAPSVRAATAEEIQTQIKPALESRFAPVLNKLLLDIRAPYIALRNDDMLDFATSNVAISVSFQRLERERCAGKRRVA